MSNYDQFLKEKPKAPAPRKKASPDLIWNILTVVMVLMTLCACGFFVSLLRDPTSSLNPFPPKTLVPPPPTATQTPLGFDATWTPTVTIQPTETATRRPTFTPIATSTPYILPTRTPNYSPTPSVIPSKTPKPEGMPYSVTVSYNDSVSFNSDASCASMYVAGRALYSNNQPAQGLQVKLGGSVPGKVFQPVPTILTGISRQYGESGFEFKLNVKPVASTKSLWVQLFDMSGAPLSEQYKLTTYTDCKKNLILVIFQQK